MDDHRGHRSERSGPEGYPGTAAPARNVLEHDCTRVPEIAGGDQFAVEDDQVVDVAAEVASHRNPVGTVPAHDAAGGVAVAVAPLGSGSDNLRLEHGDRIAFPSQSGAECFPATACPARHAAGKRPVATAEPPNGDQTVLVFDEIENGSIDARSKSGPSIAVPAGGSFPRRARGHDQERRPHTAGRCVSVCLPVAPAVAHVRATNLSRMGMRSTRDRRNPVD